MKNKTAAILVSIILMFLSSCSQMHEDDYASEIVGSWSGTYTYYNPVGGQKYVYLYLTFYEDNGGKLECEHVNDYSVAYFQWNVKGDKVYCRGARATISGDLDSDFEMSLQINGLRLIPLDRYSNFILTKDGSVVTNDKGEVIDHMNELLGVWINDNGTTVIVIDENILTEYVLSDNSMEEYVKVNTWSFRYDAANCWFYVDGVDKFEINALTSDKFLFNRCGTNDFFSYTRGKANDIPKSSNLRGILCKALVWSCSRPDESFIFRDDDTVVYFCTKGKDTLRAVGKFSLNGATLMCRYDEVYWDRAKYYPDLFPGWAADQEAYRTYTIEHCPGGSICLTDTAGNKTYYDPTY